MIRHVYTIPAFLYVTLLIWAIIYAYNVDAKTIKVAIIDSGVSHIESYVKICPDGLYDLTQMPPKIHALPIEMSDEIGHGDNVTYIIADNLRDVDYCMYIIKIYGGKSRVSNLH